MTPSSVYIMDTDEVVFSLGGRTLSKAPKIDPWGTPCFIVPQFE
jgi:hypothetical protein